MESIYFNVLTGKILSKDELTGGCLGPNGHVRIIHRRVTRWTWSGKTKYGVTPLRDM